MEECSKLTETEDQSISSTVNKNPFLHPTCGVCSKPYIDPRILPCLHSFCVQCLRCKTEKIDSQQIFKCPTCNQTASIPVGGASVLPQNLHLGFEVEVAGYMSKMVSDGEVCCDHCMDGSSGPAVVFCCSCRQFLCKFCHEHHKRGRQLSKHSMVGLDQEGAKQLQTTMKPREQHCLLLNHEDNKLKCYCKTCKSISCLECTIVSHKSHDVTELSTVAKVHREEITGAFESAGKVVTQLMGGIMGNDKMIEQVELSKRNALLVINQAFEMLYKRLKEKKEALLAELEEISLSKTTALTLQKEEFERMVKEIGCYTKVASHILQTHTDHEIVALDGLVPTQLHATVKKVQTTPLTPNQHSNFSVTLKTDDLMKELSKFSDVVDVSSSSSTWTSTSVAMTRTHGHQLKVESNTSQRKRYPFGGVKVKAEMRPKGDFKGEVVYGEVEDHRDGTYTITLTPQTAGPHQLLITMDGQHVQNSPCEMDVMDNVAIENYRVALQVAALSCTEEVACVAISRNCDIALPRATVSTDDWPCSDQLHVPCVLEWDSDSRESLQKDTRKTQLKNSASLTQPKNSASLTQPKNSTLLPQHPKLSEATKKEEQRSRFF